MYREENTFHRRRKMIVTGGALQQPSQVSISIASALATSPFILTLWCFLACYIGGYCLRIHTCHVTPSIDIHKYTPKYKSFGDMNTHKTTLHAYVWSYTTTHATLPLESTVLLNRHGQFIHESVPILHSSYME